MPVVRANIELAGRSGLPRDKTVMTFHIAADDLSAGNLNAIAEDVRDFMTITPAGSAQPLYNHVSTVINDTGHAVKIYDLGTPGSPPNHVEPFDFLGRIPQGTANYPSEVAVCLSMRNESVTSSPPRNRRGRIYFGPCRNSVFSEVALSEPRASSTFRTLLANAGNELRTRLLANATPATLVVWSRVLQTSFPVDRFHVDDEFDTVRSRGVRASTRTWSPSAP